MTNNPNTNNQPKIKIYPHPQTGVSQNLVNEISPAPIV